MEEESTTECVIIEKRHLQTLIDNHISDMTYVIRENEGKGWDGPRVSAWSDAVRAINDVLGLT